MLVDGVRRTIASVAFWHCGGSVIPAVIYKECRAFRLKKTCTPRRVTPHMFLRLAAGSNATERPVLRPPMDALGQTRSSRGRPPSDRCCC